VPAFGASMAVKTAIWFGGVGVGVGTELSDDPPPHPCIPINVKRTVAKTQRASRRANTHELRKNLVSRLALCPLNRPSPDQALLHFILKYLVGAFHRI
jgi:hypothetical protein